MEIKVKDKYNPNKTWLIKKTKCSHFVINQEIGGVKQYIKYQRVTKKYLLDLGLITKDDFYLIMH